MLCSAVCLVGDREKKQMSQEQTIIKVSEEQRGEWTETRWSDGSVTMHRPSLKTAWAEWLQENGLIHSRQQQIQVEQGLERIVQKYFGNPVSPEQVSEVPTNSSVEAR
jgi:hypothetical protein